MLGTALEFENKEGGFRVVQIGDVLHIHVWGFWHDEVPQVFRRDGLPMCMAIAEGRQLQLDATGLKPQGPEGQEELSNLLRSLSRRGEVRGTVVVDSALTKLQLLRLIKECNMSTWLQVRSGGDSFGDKRP